MEAVQSIFENVVVQVLLGVGGMVFLMALGEAIRNLATFRAKQRSKEEVQVIALLQREVAQLREEVAEVRSLAVDHSMSVDRNVELIQRRLDTLEQRIQDQQFG
jgi:hypothetical protein